MREILFRGKRSDTGGWVYGDFYHKCGVTGIVYDYMIYTRDGMVYPVIPETVDQYTGLDDKNGVKIFEGDVVRYLNSIESGNGVVIFDACAFLFNWIDINETDSLLRHFQCSKELEVICNIHDNPEVTE